jgi:hypothetical protein
VRSHDMLFAWQARSSFGDQLWSAAGWLFDFVVAQVADSASSPALSSHLREIVDEHLGALALNDLSSDDRDEVLAALVHGLQDRAAAALPTELPSRDAVLAPIADLVALADQFGSAS